MFWIQFPQNRGGHHESIFKGLIYPFVPKSRLGWGGVYQISRDVALTTCIQLYSKRTKKAIFRTPKACFFGFSALKIGGGPHEDIFKRLIYPFLPKNCPGGGAFYQISRDVAITTCIQLYSNCTREAIFGLHKHVFFEFSAPKIGGGLTKTLSKG